MSWIETLAGQRTRHSHCLCFLLICAPFSLSPWCSTPVQCVGQSGKPAKAMTGCQSCPMKGLSLSLSPVSISISHYHSIASIARASPRRRSLKNLMINIPSLLSSFSKSSVLPICLIVSHHMLSISYICDHFFYPPPSATK